MGIEAFHFILWTLPHSQYESFCFPDHAGWKLTGNRLSITGIGTIKVKVHRDGEGTIKTCTIKREGAHWYLVLACEVQSQPRLPYTDLAVGIDMGLLHFATLSTEDTIEAPRFFRLSEKKLATAQQALARKKRGSKRRKKAVNTQEWSLKRVTSIASRSSHFFSFDDLLAIIKKPLALIL